MVLRLDRLKSHLELLARAANVAQAMSCRLDQILLIFGSLYIHYASLADDEDKTGANAILRSIEQRWAKADQDVFIAAVILNPFVRVSPFCASVPFLNIAGILSLLKRLYTCFFRTPAPVELHRNLQDYLVSTGPIFHDLQSYMETIESEAARQVGTSSGFYLGSERSTHQMQKVTPNPITVYEGLCHPGQDPPPLIKLAMHILSICANSASCERLFSTFGNILTKLRSRLGHNTMVDLAELKMHIRDEHLRSGTASCLKRFFGAKPNPDNASGPPPSNTGRS